ncbi:unnamed protein product [Owenia fusiformis]|uniref:Uncharacterized protein n=1 Tax=Owenia fusiformis TaxID=6347 RepID=A0A8J1TEG4_OWEFU|nr:unnamed protein product [Owenia fusiformis]
MSERSSSPESCISEEEQAQRTSRHMIAQLMEGVHPSVSTHISRLPHRPRGRTSTKKQMSEEELQDLRLKINGRERKRMHDLNSALEGLREVMPYSGNPSVRKLSKISTLLLAKNYILVLTRSLEELKSLVGDVHKPTSIPTGPMYGARTDFHNINPAASLPSASATVSSPSGLTSLLAPVSTLSPARIPVTNTHVPVTNSRVPVTNPHIPAMNSQVPNMISTGIFPRHPLTFDVSPSGCLPTGRILLPGGLNPTQAIQIPHIDPRVAHEQYRRCLLETQNAK